MHEYFPKHLRMGTARMKQDKETEEEGKMRRMNTESTAGTKKSPDGLTVAWAYRPHGVATLRSSG